MSHPTTPGRDGSSPSPEPVASGGQQAGQPATTEQVSPGGAPRPNPDAASPSAPAAGQAPAPQSPQGQQSTPGAPGAQPPAQAGQHGGHGAPPPPPPAPGQQPGFADPTTWAVGEGSLPSGVYPPPQGTTPWNGAAQGPQTSSFGTYQSGPTGQNPSSGSGRVSGVRRAGELLVVAVLAAALASGGTWSLLQPKLTHQTRTEESGRPVEQADPQNPNWTATAKAVSPSVVSIRVTGGSAGGEGSGVILDTKGNVVTNHHVVAAGGSTPKIQVALDDKRVYDAEIVGTDPRTDLAVLRLKDAPSDLQPVAMGDDTKLRVGDPVMAVGNPLGLSGTVTTGIVSALNRPVSTQRDDPSGTQATPVVTNAVQISAAINPGNSGGALVNGSGQLIGINSSIAALSQNSGSIGIGFAIPVNEVKNVTAQLLTSGKAQHAFLGVTLAAPDEAVSEGSTRRAAAKIVKVSQGSAAEKAGIKAGDAVVAVDGETVDGRLALQAQISERKAKDTVTLTIVRDGKRQDVRVTLDEDQRN